MKYRKKPVVIEAELFDGTEGSALAIKAWGGADIDLYYDEVMEFGKEQGVQIFSELYILTLEGTMHVSPGDYVIQGVQGEFYPCKPDIFEETYEIVDEELIDPFSSLPEKLM